MAKGLEDNFPELSYYSKDLDKTLYYPIGYTGNDDNYHFCTNHDGFYECDDIECSECLRDEMNAKYLEEYMKIKQLKK